MHRTQLAFVSAFLAAGAAMAGTLEVSVPFEFGAEASFEDGVRDLRRLREEFGVKRVFVTGCPGLGVRISGWSDDDAPFVKFGEMLAKAKTAVADTGLEIGWWNAPTMACAKNGPFQFMIGASGREALHSPCPLDAKFSAAFCHRIKLVASRAKPAAILFEDDLHFNGQRDKTNDGWTGPCCYCPLHLEKLAAKCGRRYTREGLIAAMAGDGPAAKKLRSEFEETLAESMMEFGMKIRAALDEVSPATKMGMSGSGDIFHNDGMALKYARAIAGKYRPFIRIPASLYDSNGSFEEMLSWTQGALWNFRNCPKDIERMHEMDTYPHNRYYMPDALVSALMATAVAYGAESMLFYGTQYLDDPLESDGYFQCLRRENAKLAALRDAVRGMELVGVRLIGRDPGAVPFLARYGLPVALSGNGPALLVGNAAAGMNDEDLKAELEKGGFVIDGRSGDEVTRRGFAALLGAEVKAVNPIPAASELVLDAAKVTRIPGRKLYNFNFAAPTKAEKCDFAEIRGEVETWVEYVGALGEKLGPSVAKTVRKDGGKVGLVSTTIPGNRSAALYSLRKREALVNLLEETGGEICARVADERNVELIANSDGRSLVLTVIVLRPDILDHLDLVLSKEWLGRPIESLADDGTWHPLGALAPASADPRTLRLPGVFRPGVSRGFRLRK